MKKTITILMLILFMTGCSTSKPVSTELSIQEAMPSESASTSPNNLDAMPSESANTSPSNLDANQEKTFFELKAEFEDNIELEKQALSSGSSSDTHWTTYSANNIRVFEEMLDCRQGMEDFIEWIKTSQLRINVEASFVDGGTNYRIIKYFPGYPPIFRMYIQIFDEDSLESQLVYAYQHEGGIEGDIPYCGFQQGYNSVYLIIIHRVYGINTTPGYYLINYELDGKVIRNYNALREEISDSSWELMEELTNLGVIVTKITRDNRLDLSNSHIMAFDDNVLVLIVNNEEKDEISLLFGDGYWEQIVKDLTVSTPLLNNGGESTPIRVYSTIDPSLYGYDESNYSFITVEVSAENFLQDAMKHLYLHNKINVDDIWYEGNRLCVDLNRTMRYRLDAGSTAGHLLSNELLLTFASFPNIDEIVFTINGAESWGNHFNLYYIFPANKTLQEMHDNAIPLFSW